MRLVDRIPYVQQLRTVRDVVRAFGAGPGALGLAARYSAARLFPERSDVRHLEETMAWIARAQDECGGDGVANVFYLASGFGVAYPETSGYIIATYLTHAANGGGDEFVRRAIQLGDWEIAVQAPNGGIYSSIALKQTRVFNTGQVILGWCALYEHTRDKRYLRAAERAGDYLLREQTAEGTWVKDTYCGARTYHARVDWGLLRLAELTGRLEFAAAAVRNLEWVLAQQRPNGWFAACGFNDDRPIMHVIVYTLRGLLESSQVVADGVEALGILSRVVVAADALCDALEAQPVRGIAGMVSTAFDEQWRSTDEDSCLTGNAQLCCFLYRLAQCTGSERYRRVADVVLSATKRTQSVDTSILPVRGAIAGSYPIAHGYVPNGYPNWAAKFFADALLMKIHFAKRLVVTA